MDMRKLFRRREMLSARARDIILAVALTWVVRSWFDWDWGGELTPLWWVNIALASVVVLALCLLASTKPRVEKPDRDPFDVELRAYLKRHDYSLITNETATELLVGVKPTPWRTVPDNAHAGDCALCWRTASAFECTCPSRATEDDKS